MCLWRSKSLRTLIDSDRYGSINKGIKLTSGNVGYSDGIYTLPYFCTFLVKELILKLLKHPVIVICFFSGHNVRNANLVQTSSGYQTRRDGV